MIRYGSGHPDGIARFGTVCNVPEGYGMKINVKQTNYMITRSIKIGMATIIRGKGQQLEQCVNSGVWEAYRQRIDEAKKYK